MSVQREIGFFKGIVDRSSSFARSHNLSIQPQGLPNDQNIETSALKTVGGVRDSEGASGIMHWNFHAWGDVDNVVGK